MRARPHSRDTPILIRRVSRPCDRRRPAGTTRRRVIAAAILLLAAGPLGAPLGAQQHPLVAIPLGDPAYEQLDALARLGCAAADLSPVRPYILRDVREMLRRTAGEPACEGALRDVLLARFAADSARRDDQVPDSAVLTDVEGRPIPVEVAGEGGEEAPRIRFGAAATLRATAHGNGEIRPLWREVRPLDEGDPALVGILRARLTWDGGERLAGVVEGFAQTDRRNDPLVRAGTFRGTDAVVDFSEAYLTGRAGRLVATFGRRRVAWLGEGEESVALSAHGPPLDHLALSLRWPKFEAHALYGAIDDVVLDTLLDALPSGTPDQRFYRFLVAHAIAWRPTPSLRFTIGETALLSRGARVLDLGYANPLMIYWVTQEDLTYEDRENRDNLGIFLQGRGTIGGATVVGDLLVDDFQIDSEDRERIPDQLAWSVRVAGPLPTTLPATIGAEYRRTGSFTYLKGRYSEAFQQYDAPLGSELGPDADLLRLSAELWPLPVLSVRASGGYWRRGAQRLDDRPSQRAQGNAGLPFPSVTPARPAVQRAVLGDLAVRWLAFPLPVTVRVELARIANANNQPAPSALYVRAQLIGTYAYRYP